jgi:hypothetical protein
MQGSMTIRYQVILATEQFAGAYHTGDANQAYGIAVPIQMSKDSDRFTWGQLPVEGKIDPRMPVGGECRDFNGDVVLMERGTGRLVATLTGMKILFLPEFQPPQAGTVVHAYGSVALKQRDGHLPASTITANLKGKWTVLQNTFKYSIGEGLQSGWKFKTSSMTSLAIGGGIAAGTLVLTNPYGTDISFTLGGAGVGLDPTKYLKAASAALKAIIKAVQAFYKDVSAASAGYSTTEMWSAGYVIKNPAWIPGWGRAMTTRDFCGLAVWAEANLVVGIGGGVQLFLVGIDPIGSFRAVIPMAGEGRVFAVGAGAFACIIG